MKIQGEAKREGRREKREEREERRGKREARRARLPVNFDTPSREGSADKLK